MTDFDPHVYTDADPTSSQVVKILAASLSADVPTLIWGDPGEGKSARISQMLRQWTILCKIVIGSYRERTDILGFPAIDDENRWTMHYPERWAVELYRHSREHQGLSAVAVLDEFNLAGEDTMKAMLQFMNEGIIGDLDMHGVRRIGIANPVESSSFGDMLTPPVANRFLHLNWDLDFDQWAAAQMVDFDHDEQVPPLHTLIAEDTPERRAWANSIVVSYLRANPANWKPGAPRDASVSSGAWPSPRSWTNLAKLLRHLPADDLVTIMFAAQGLVGEQVGRDFAAKFRLVADLPDPRQVIDQRRSFAWQTYSDNMVMYALCLAVANYATHSNADRWRDAAETLMIAHLDGHGRDDCILPSVRTLLTGQPAGVSLPRGFTDTFSTVLDDIGYTAPSAAPEPRSTPDLGGADPFDGIEF